MASVAAPVLIDRVDIHKSCKSLEAIVAVLVDYTEAANAVAVVQRKLAKALKDVANVKGTHNVPANAMVTSAGVFEALAEVDGKFAKIADREADNVGSDLRKWFKKLTKEEKAHDERITNANAKIKQAGQAYEKKAKKKDRDAVDEHSRYVAILNAVGPEMSQDKYNHSLFVTQRHNTTLSSFAATLSRLAEAEWTRSCENVRRSAPSIGSVGEWRALCEGGWSGSIPGDLPDVGTVEHERERKSNEGVDRTVKALDVPQPPNVATALVHPNEYLGSPISAKLPPPAGKSSESHQTTEHLNSNTTMSRPSSPPNTQQVILNTLKKKPAYSGSDNEHSPVTQRAIQARSSSDNSSTGTALSLPPAAGTATLTEHANALRVHDDSVSMPQDSSRPTGRDPDPEDTVEAEAKPNHKSLSPDLPPPFSSRDPFSGERNQAHLVKKVDFMDERERKTTTPPKPLGVGRNVNIGGNLDRRSSIESTTSNQSLVASMRDRYDTRLAKSSSPPPRDLPRLVQSVTNLATRYTPIDGPPSPPRVGGTPAPSGASGDRFITFQDRHPRPSVDKFERERDRYRAAPEPAAPNRDYFTDRDKERYRYLESPAVDRNWFSRDDRDRERHRIARSRSPDTQHAEELRMPDRQHRIETVEELEQREAYLREQERQLDIERMKLANAREGGYTSDTGGRSYREGGPYGAGRRSESPGPMTSQQSLRPPPAPSSHDHSPNCGCQRCSAQHYASTPSLPRSRRDSGAPEQPIYKPDPPILLRPEKPKNWIRRMSMPVASLVSSNDKDLGASSTAGQNWRSMALPEEDGRIKRRSFELERDRDARFGGTSRR